MPPTENIFSDPKDSQEQSQSTPTKDSQEIQPTQINEDFTDLNPQSQPDPSPKSNPEDQPWAILISLSEPIEPTKIPSNVNSFGIGRHRGKLPPTAPFKVDLLIDRPNSCESVSRWHALIQRKGVENDEKEPLSQLNASQQKPPHQFEKLIRDVTLPNNGHNGKVAISLCDYSSNGTFINQKRCQKFKWTKLEHGDEIALGSVKGNLNKPDNSFVWLVSIPSHAKFPMQKMPPSRSSLTCQKIYEQYDFLLQLGKGAFATTWKAFDRNSGEYRAIKVIRKGDYFHDPQNLINFQREISILKSIDHPNIVKFHESYEDDHLIWIVLELVDGGEYLDYVCNADGLDEDSCRWITRMLLKALDYLSRLNIAHRDLKPENILMSSGKNPVAKIADFGLAKQLKENSCFKTACGTPAYVAPEVVLPSQNSTGYTVAVDMYSLGVVVYASLGNCSPFDGQDIKGDIQEACRKRVVNTQVLSRMRPDLSQDALDFINQLTARDVKKRLAPAQALKHRWILNLNRNKLSPGHELPENPVKTVTNTKGKQQKAIAVSSDQNCQQQGRQILGCNDLNIELDETKPIDLSPESPNDPAGKKPKELVKLDDSKIHIRNDFLDTGISSWAGKSEEDNYDRGEASGTSCAGTDVRDEPETFSQQLKEMRLETPSLSSSSRMFQFDEEQDGLDFKKSLCSTPSQFKGVESDDEEGQKSKQGSNEDLTRSAVSKRKLRQWSTSPKLAPNHQKDDQDNDKEDKKIEDDDEDDEKSNDDDNHQVKIRKKSDGFARSLIKHQNKKPSMALDKSSSQKSKGKRL